MAGGCRNGAIPAHSESSQPMKHAIKSGLRSTLSALPGGVRLYRWLTASLFGTQAGMAAKWFRVFPAHVGVLQEVFGDGARDLALWCFDCGANPAAGYACAVGTDRPGLLTDRHDRLINRYVEVSRNLLREKGPALAELSKAPDGRVDELLGKSAAATAIASLEGVGMTYSKRHDLAAGPDWKGKIGCIFSAGTLEHYRPEELEKLIEVMRDSLMPGGVLSHVMDHRDHRWHADKTISPFLHYTMSDAEFLAKFGGPLDYHNRWLQSQWVAFFESHGFEVECRPVFRYTDDLVPIDRETLAEPFRSAPENDLDCLVTHYVAKLRK